MLIKLEAELIMLCEEVVDLLYELRKKSLISEEEFNTHSKHKLKFMQEYTETAVLQ